MASLRSVTLHLAPRAARQALVGDAQASTRTARAESRRRSGSHGRGPWTAGARIGAEARPAAQRACRLREAERRRRRSASTELTASRTRRQGGKEQEALRFPPHGKCWRLPPGASCRLSPMWVDPGLEAPSVQNAPIVCGPREPRLLVAPRGTRGARQRRASLSGPPSASSQPDTEPLVSVPEGDRPLRMR